VIVDRRDVLISEIAAENALELRPVLEAELDLDGDDLAAVTFDEREIRPVECVVSVPMGSDDRRRDRLAGRVLSGAMFAVA
jgi:hypothetical protein